MYVKSMKELVLYILNELLAFARRSRFYISLCPSVCSWTAELYIPYIFLSLFYCLPVSYIFVFYRISLELFYALLSLFPYVYEYKTDFIFLLANINFFSYQRLQTPSGGIGSGFEFSHTIIGLFRAAQALRVVQNGIRAGYPFRGLYQSGTFRDKVKMIPRSGS